MHPNLYANIRRATLGALLCAALLLQGCLLQSDTPVLFGREKASALNLLAEKTPDISGTYAINNPQTKKQMQLVFAPVEKSDNAYIVTAKNDKSFPVSRVFVEVLDGKSALLLQFSENKKKADEYVLIPARTQKDGLTLFPMFMIGGAQASAWDKSVWQRVCKQYNLSRPSEERIRRGNLTPEQYSKNVKAAFADMFAANALGPGLRLPNMEHIQAAQRAAKEERERIPRSIASFAKSSPQEAQAELQKGFTPNTQDPTTGGTALMAAARNADPQVSAILLAAGAKADVRDKNGATALHAAAAANNPKVLELLLQAGADINARTSSGNSALHSLASSHGSGSGKDAFALLLRAGADVNLRNEYGATPLMHIMPGVSVGNQQESKLELARIMLDAKADINARDTEGRGALDDAILGGSEVAVRFLLQAGATPGYRDKDGASPLTSAIWQKMSAATIRMLLDALPEPKDKQILSSAFVLVLNSDALAHDKDLIRLFLKAGADINTRSAHGETLLMIEAGGTAPPDFFIELLSYGPDARVKDQFGQDVSTIAKSTRGTPLLFWIIARLENPAQLDMLLKAGINARERDANGATVLMKAAAENTNPEIIRLLCQSGIDARVQAKDGTTALQAAEKNRNPEVLEAVRQCSGIKPAPALKK